jgi:hypothetical protein
MPYVKVYIGLKADGSRKRKALRIENGFQKICAGSR